VGGGAKHKDGNHKDGDGAEEEFALDAHDLSLENVFVDPTDPTVIVSLLFQVKASTYDPGRLA
jgi:hypothetical protein